MTAQRGIRHDSEPEVDSLSYIDFEDDDQGYQTAQDAGTTLEVWFVDAAAAFLTEAGIPFSGERLFEEYQCSGPAIFWDWVVEQAVDAGFDVYDSDTRTELFPAGQDCGDPDCLCQEAKAYGDDGHQSLTGQTSVPSGLYDAPDPIAEEALEYLVVINSQVASAFPAGSLEEAVELLNKYDEAWGGQVLAKRPNEAVWQGGYARYDDDLDRYVIDGEEVS